VLQWPPKGYNNPYDPLNYDPNVVREYGGYADDGGRFGGGRFSGRYTAFICCYHNINVTFDG